MKKIVHSTLFTEPISRRTFYWVLFLCPVAALWLYLASRRVTVAAPSGVAASAAS